jgi:hypothetical protein
VSNAFADHAFSFALSFDDVTVIKFNCCLTNELAINEVSLQNTSIVLVVFLLF